MLRHLGNSPRSEYQSSELISGENAAPRLPLCSIQGVSTEQPSTPHGSRGKRTMPFHPLPDNGNATPDKRTLANNKSKFLWFQHHGKQQGQSRDERSGCEDSDTSRQVDPQSVQPGSKHDVPTQFCTPRAAASKIEGRHLNSEPCNNSGQSFNGTPKKSVSRSLKYNQAGASSTIGRGGSNVSLTKSETNNSHFELEEDLSFWKDHNVQVLIRSRPLNSNEISVQGHARCLRQDSAHSLTWIGPPESRFTFDHVACETITQERLFRVAGLPMVENCISGYNSCMFAYGQTGSGKTHTMLGDICDANWKQSDGRGMTPRVFEYLFVRIQKEEEIRKSEKLKIACRCSFLEIYNEQITDLLEPASINLQIREDAKKGVYVENLTEVEVTSVEDVIKLLFQGSANRKVAATNMNRESSRSHSVFTCVVESKWESDSVINTRFGRLHLVDLAGSERQKNSGAEGDRLKEAANINKSLSTLGMVIMVLVDAANGKPRHIPYRDSKLTFLLQDSLGGNSKTTIIANISPSISCSLETLSTLKFAQRAKFIRNNAVVNENTSADVLALLNEIQQLKEELRSQNPGKPVRSLCSDGNSIILSREGQELLAGSLRRETSAECSVKQLQAEIEHLNRLVKQREDDTQCGKMMLRFREDKIRRLEAVLEKRTNIDTFCSEEKDAMITELKLLRSRIDHNPELTRFAMENIRLMEELKRYQDFYDHGERELMAFEITNLREQMVLLLDQKLTSPENTCEIPDHASLVQRNEELLTDVSSLQRLVEESEKRLRCNLEENEKLARQSHNLANENHHLKEELQVTRAKVEAADVDQEAHMQTIESLKFLLQKSEQREESRTMQLEERLNGATKEMQELRTLNSKEIMELRQKLENALGESREWQLATDKLIVYLTEGDQALETAAKEMQDIIDDSFPSPVSFMQEKGFCQIVSKISEKYKTVEALQAKLQEAFMIARDAEIQVRSMNDSLTELQSKQKDDMEREIQKIRLQSEGFKCSLNQCKSNLSRAEDLAFAAFLVIQKVSKSGEERTDELSKQLSKSESVIQELQMKQSNDVELVSSLKESLRAANGRAEAILVAMKHLADEQGQLVLQMEDAEMKSEMEKQEQILKLQNLLESRNHDAQAKLRDAESMIEECGETYSSVVKMVDSIEYEMKDAVCDMQVFESEANHLIADLKTSVTEARNDFDQLKNEVVLSGENFLARKLAVEDALQEKLLCAEEHCKRLKLEVCESSIEMQHLQDLLAISNAEKLKLSTELAKSQEKCARVQDDNIAAVSDVDELAKNVQELVEHIEQLEEGNLWLRDEKEKQMCTIQDLMNKVKVSDTEAEKLQIQVQELNIEVCSLRDEVVRKEEVLKGLGFDMSLLQESLTETKEKEKEIAVANCELQEKLNIKENEVDRMENVISSIRAELCGLSNRLNDMEVERNDLKEMISRLTAENAVLKETSEELQVEKNYLENEVEEKRHVIENLDLELLELSSLVEQKISDSLRSAHHELQLVMNERDQLHADLLVMNEQIEMVQSLADERESLAREARQMAEQSKASAEEKEEEVKLLERSVEELESTVNALENQVGVIKREAQAQRVIKADLETEIEELKHEVLMHKNASIETASADQGLKEEIARLNEECGEKDSQILACKKHISDVMTASTRQAGHQQKKIHELEASLDQARSTRSKGSGSPFKCMGLGVSQQITSEIDEELCANRRRIDELESIAAARQTEVFMLNARLAEAESMSHDVVRDLLGVKMDIAHYAANEEMEVCNLRKQLDELNLQKESWLNEINRRQNEIAETRGIVDDLRLRNEMLVMENEKLKAENIRCEKQLGDAEEQVRKLSGQQNLQQRIHHHAKIKEENNALKAELRRAQQALFKGK